MSLLDLESHLDAYRERRGWSVANLHARIGFTAGVLAGGIVVAQVDVAHDQFWLHGVPYSPWITAIVLAAATVYLLFGERRDDDDQLIQEAKP